MIVVTDYRQKRRTPTRDQRGAPLSRRTTADSEATAFDAEELKPPDDTFVAAISLEGVGISVIDQKLRELVYATFRGIDLTMNDSPARTSYGLITRWIQIDNQLEASPVYPTLLRPDLEYDPELLELRPNFQAELVHRKDNSK